MSARKSFWVLFIFFLFPLLVLLSHQSQNPVIGRWSSSFFLLLLAYGGWVILWLFFALYVQRWGACFCLYLAGIYLLAFAAVDFVLGYRYFHSMIKLKDHPVYHHTLVPGIHHLHISENSFLDRRYLMSVNRDRLRRETEVSLEKQNGLCRILALGDSFTEGKGVNDHETFCSRLEEYLNADKKNNRKYEVLNSGVDSYAPVLEYLYLKTDGIRFNPDLVLLFFDMSDLANTNGYLKRTVWDQEGNIIAVSPQRQSWGERARRFITTHFYYAGNWLSRSLLAKQKNNAIGRTPEEEIFQFALAADQKPWEKEWKAVEEHINWVYRFCQGRNIRFGLVIYPWGFQVNDSEWAEGRKEFNIPQNYTAPADLSFMLQDRFKKEFPVLNLFPSFRSYSGEKLLYYKKDMHWTPEGHDLVARRLFEFLNEDWAKNL
ncbi:MAG: hypothetical protein HYS56_03975 [Candidatus Omnitrophica bacterium]|nr:hypothetical protein [Candidatus Omnitrophota bacterium]